MKSKVMNDAMHFVTHIPVIGYFGKGHKLKG